MEAYRYLIEKQVQWALNRGLKLQGSKGERGLPRYTKKLNDNLYEELSPDVLQEYELGDGAEIRGDSENPAKMQAVHSSSALTVNIFQYWKKCRLLSEIALALGSPFETEGEPYNLAFEKKLIIDKGFRYHPNIDVILTSSSSKISRWIAVECKFTEAYRIDEERGLKEKYIGLHGTWDDIPSLRELAKSISPKDQRYGYLHSAQLIKHILSLKKERGKEGFKLIYLWYDAYGKEGACHREETKDFSLIAEQDGISFLSMTFQELILKLASRCRPTHDEYIRYVTGRYL